jgi:hypothetical protein
MIYLLSAGPVGRLVTLAVVPVLVDMVVGVAYLLDAVRPESCPRTFAHVVVAEFLAYLMAHFTYLCFQVMTTTASRTQATAHIAMTARWPAKLDATILFSSPKGQTAAS